MKELHDYCSLKYPQFLFIAFMLFAACDRNSSPEGRMSIKIENLQKEMIDSLRVHNQAIRDSLSNIRRELNQLREERNKK